jgi:hypothetical protein
MFCAERREVFECGCCHFGMWAAKKTGENVRFVDVRGCEEERRGADGI